MRIALITAVALSFAAGTSVAQQAPGAHQHRGLWGGFGVGGGINLSEGLDGKQLGGGVGWLRIGGTPSQRVLLGFEGIFWGRDESGNGIARGNGAFTVMFYPSANGGAFLKGGIGGASISRATTSGNSTTTTSQGGFGLTLGTGWDVRLGSNLYLVPGIDLLLQWFESKTDPVLGEIPGTNSIVTFTLGLTWH
jgi:hypothetical protein